MAEDEQYGGPDRRGPARRGPARRGPDRRERYRLDRETRILIKGDDPNANFSQVGIIQNMTRNGIFFVAFGDYHPGMLLQVVFPDNPAKASTVAPQRAEVVRVQEMEGSLKKGVAIKLVNLFLKP